MQPDIEKVVRFYDQLNDFEKMEMSNMILNGFLKKTTDSVNAMCWTKIDTFLFENEVSVRTQNLLKYITKEEKKMYMEELIGINFRKYRNVGINTLGEINHLMRKFKNDK